MKSGGAAVARLFFLSESLHDCICNHCNTLSQTFKLTVNRLISTWGASSSVISDVLKTDIMTANAYHVDE